MLEIKNLTVKHEEKIIIKDLSLKIHEGERHVIMGPNGAGKSTLTKILVGDPTYSIVKGDIIFLNESILTLDTENRAKKGVFVGFQNPPEIPGLINKTFLLEAFNSLRESRGEIKVSESAFLVMIEEFLKELEINKDFLFRGLNEGFSGGEKKKNEMLQLLIFKPKIAVLDELDSGLDIDALKLVSLSIQNFFNKNRKHSLLLITHYSKLVEYIEPDFIHIFCNGSIVKTGDKALAHALDLNGYEQLLEV